MEIQGSPEVANVTLILYEFLIFPFNTISRISYNNDKTKSKSTQIKKKSTLQQTSLCVFISKIIDLAFCVLCLSFSLSNTHLFHPLVSALEWVTNYLQNDRFRNSFFFLDSFKLHESRNGSLST